jgi:hypothetical protein
MRIAAGAVSVLLGLGFGLPCIVGIRQFARSGEVWTFLGFPTYGNGPFHRIGLPTSIPLLMGFLAVCLAELAVGAMIWLDARPSSVRWRCCRSSSSSGWDSHCRLVRRSEPPAPVRVPKEPAFESPDSTPPPEAQAVSTAARFAAAWARPDLPADQWSTGVKPWCTARYGALLEHLDSGSIPARRVSGPPKPAHRETRHAELRRFHRCRHPPGHGHRTTGPMEGHQEQLPALRRREGAPTSAGTNPHRAEPAAARAPQHDAAAAGPAGSSASLTAPLSAETGPTAGRSGGRGSSSRPVGHSRVSPGGNASWLGWTRRALASGLC